ncbi:hypothetical protein M3Y98_01027300 [Aphelenchoides besseyi]|nr:hypothetical protein M3Y98_01027300 [Aphelenchoides besseyi]
MDTELSTSMYCPSGMDQTQQAAQQMRFSSNSEINSETGFVELSSTFNKRRACSNGFPTQLLTTCGWTPTASTNITSSSGFGGSNTVGELTNSFASINALIEYQQQKPLSRSLESLAVCAGPSLDPLMCDYSTAFFNDIPQLSQPLHYDDSRINYSFDYDSGIGNGSVNSTTTATVTTTGSFSSSDDTIDKHVDKIIYQEQQTPNCNNNFYDEIIESMEQCRPFGQLNDFEMDES